MKLKLILIIFFINILNTTHANILNNEIEGAKTTIKDTALATKYILTTPKIAKKRISEALEIIKKNCCEENFKFKNEMDKISKNLQECLDKKCHNYILPIYNKDKPPLKVVVLKQINLLDDLFIENEKQQYENLVQKLENDKQSEKLKNQNDINLIKKQLSDLEKENLKLKKTVDKMLASYQKKIKNLKEENKRITNNFDIVYRAHSKNRQKKLDESLK